MIRVVIVDDHPIVRRGLAQVFSHAPDMTIVGEASGVSDALPVIEREDPDVICSDLKLADGDGTDLIGWISRHARGVPLVLTTYDQPALARSAIVAGARGYLLKDADEDLLFAAVRAVAEGSTYFATSISKKLGDVVDAGVVLSDREIEVLRLASQGSTNLMIARSLGIHEGTVKTYFARVFTKLGVSTRAQAVATALQRGFILSEGGE